jgi:Zn-dependent M28 family amino/carboxypeptidase
VHDVVVRQPRFRSTAVAARLLTFLLLLACVASVSAGGVSAGGRSQEAVPTRGAIVKQLPQALSLSRMRRDLRALERIADRNGGTRAAGTPGYAASVGYVAAQLRRAGYGPRVMTFPYVEYLELVEHLRQLGPVQRELSLEALEYSPSTPTGGLRARVVASGDGCSPGDFRAVRGLIALVERGTCFFAVKAANAQAAGAAAVLVFNNQEGKLDGTLGDPKASGIPVAGITRSLGRDLAAAASPIVEMELVTETRSASSQNVTANTRPTAPEVLIAGAHLDSVRDGPGINDNATGVVALLEIARALAKSSRPLAVRFAFWGAEELGLFGSRDYARRVRPSRIVGYLNFDVLGSPSRRYGVYGDAPFTTGLLRYLERTGAAAAQIDIEGRSDHAPFARRGIPVAGLFAGAYPCYHRACDRVAKLDLRTFETLAKAAAFGVASFAPLER